MTKAYHIAGEHKGVGDALREPSFWLSRSRGRVVKSPEAVTNTSR
jgi:hypothetical protein